MLNRNELLKNNLLMGMLVLFSALLSACSSKENLNTGKYKPELNPHPKYFFNVGGDVSPKLINHLDIKWQVTYIGSDKKCDYISNSVEGVSSPRTVTINYHPKPDKHGRYHISIPLDKYLPGYCKWSVFEVDNNIGSGRLTTVTQFSPCGSSTQCGVINEKKISKYRKKGLYDAICTLRNHQQYECILAKNSIMLSNNFLAPKKSSYSFKEIFSLKNEALR